MLYVALIGLSLIWGLSFVFIENLIGDVGVWGTVFLRCLTGAVTLTPLLLMRMIRKKVPRSLPWKSLIIIGIFNAGLPWGLIALSQTTITSNTAAVLNALTPILTGVIGFIIFSIILNKRQWGGIVLGFIGIMILMNFNVTQLHASNFVGVGTMVLATTCYGFASHFTRRYAKDVNVIVLTSFSLYVGACVGIVGVIITNYNVFAVMLNAVDITFVVSLIGLGCFGSGIAHLLYYYMINNRSAAFASTVTYLVPLTALLWGNILLGEPITKNLVMGLLTIFLGVFLANQKTKTNTGKELAKSGA